MLHLGQIFRMVFPTPSKFQQKSIKMYYKKWQQKCRIKVYCNSSTVEQMTIQNIF